MDKVWYVSYGSNLSYNRFKCYIEGGTPEGSAIEESGCLDKTLPHEMKCMELPYEMLFVEHSKRWENQGVAVLNPEKNPSYKTYGRMYLIDKNQFIEIVRQENHDPNIHWEMALPKEDIVINQSLYGRVLYLGEDDGYPVYTFTTAISLSDLKINRPSLAYLQTIAKGLVEVYHWSLDNVVMYLMQLKGMESYEKHALQKAFGHMILPLTHGRFNELSRYYVNYHTEIHDLLMNNLILWRRKYQLGTLMFEGFLFYVYYPHQADKMYFSEPVGNHEDSTNLKNAIDEWLEYCKTHCFQPRMRNVQSRFKEKLQQLSYDFKAEAKEEQFDYCYDSGQLADLSGNRYHKKKNHVNQFQKRYGETVMYKTLTTDVIADALEFMTKWCVHKGCENTYDLCYEYQGIMETLTHWKVCMLRGLTGGMLYVDKKPIALTFGEPLNDQIFVTHIEKAFSNYEGAYAAINQFFAQNLRNDYDIINREQDLGIEGLRQAKKSYHPVFMAEKFEVLFII